MARPRPEYKVSAQGSESSLPKWVATKKQRAFLKDLGYTYKQIAEMPGHVANELIRDTIEEMNDNMNYLGYEFWKD